MQATFRHHYYHSIQEVFFKIRKGCRVLGIEKKKCVFFRAAHLPTFQQLSLSFAVTIY